MGGDRVVRQGCVAGGEPSALSFLNPPPPPCLRDSDTMSKLSLKAAGGASGSSTTDKAQKIGFMEVRFWPLVPCPLLGAALRPLTFFALAQRGVFELGKVLKTEITHPPPPPPVPSPETRQDPERKRRAHCVLELLRDIVLGA